MTTPSGDLLRPPSPFMASSCCARHCETCGHFDVAITETIDRQSKTCQFIRVETNCTQWHALCLICGNSGLSGRGDHGESFPHHHGRRGAGADRAPSPGHRAPDHRHAARLHGAGWFWRDVGQRRIAARTRGCADQGGMDAARATGMLVVHTREGQLPDLSDARRPRSSAARRHCGSATPDRWDGS